MPLLELQNLCVSYGNVQALRNLDLYIDEGEIVSILGANGAGKSTVLLSVSGLIRPGSGNIIYNGQSLLKVPAYDIVSLGIAQSPEGRRVFGIMSVLENLKLGAFRVKDRNSQDSTLGWIFELFPRLYERRNQLAGTLSGGEQQMLAIGRALMAKPKLLLLDEPSLGLAPLLVKSIFLTLRKISSEGVTILLVEQNAAAALRLADRGYVLEVGRVVINDSAKNLLTNEKVAKAYLGK